MTMNDNERHFFTKNNVQCYKYIPKTMKQKNEKQIFR